jgi:hypothetical protein
MKRDGFNVRKPYLRKAIPLLMFRIDASRKRGSASQPRRTLAPSPPF